MLELRDHVEGVLLPVQAQPGAKRNAVTGIHAGRLKIAVTQVAEKGKANKELIQVLARELGLKPAQCILLHGETSSKKQFLIRGETVAALEQRIAAIGLQ